MTQNNQSRIPKHLLFNLNDDNQQQQISVENIQQNSTGQREVYMFTNQNNGKYEINSLKALANSMEHKRDSKSPLQKGNDMSPVKRQRIRLNVKKNRQLRQKGEINLAEYEVLEDLQSINSMDGSMMQFAQIKRGQTGKGQFQVDSEDINQQKSQSPQKFHKNLKNKNSKKASLLSPPELIKSQCYKFLNTIYEQLDCEAANDKLPHKVHEFLHNPLPLLQNSFMRYLFQIHFFKYTFTFHSMYEFYLRRQNGQMLHILQSKKDSLSMSSSHVLHAVNPHQPSTKEFTAKLKYNTVKSEYNLYDIDEKTSLNQQRKLLGTVIYDKKLTHQIRDIQTYVPKAEFAHNDFFKSEEKNNLFAYYQEFGKSLNDRKIQKLTTSHIPKAQEQNARQQFCLKNQGRRVLFLNEDKLQTFFMGKIQDSRYLILASGGITPLQIFTMAAVNLDH